jgi:hypothetical protein
MQASGNAGLADTYHKFGPTPASPVPHWYEFLYDGSTGAEFDGGRIILHFVDGGRGDDDLTANGRVTDIGAPGSMHQQGNDDGGACFIATAAYGSYLDPQVKVLRDFRDHYLLTNAPGRAFVACYYANSPALADFIRAHEALRTLTRWGLTPVVYAAGYPLWSMAIFVLSLMMIAYVKRRKKMS